MAMLLLSKSTDVLYLLGEGRNQEEANLEIS
jgi:hypothetical protein